jgi:hypothetical protein
MAKATSQSGEPEHTMRKGNITMVDIIATKTLAVVSAVGWPLRHDTPRVWPAPASQTLLARGSVPPGVQLSRTERLLQVLPTGMDEFGVAPDLIDLDLGAVALYVRLLEYIVEFGVLIYAMDDVAEDLLLPPDPARVTPKEEPP